MASSSSSWRCGCKFSASLGRGDVASAGDRRGARATSMGAVARGSAGSELECSARCISAGAAGGAGGIPCRSGVGLGGGGNARGHSSGGGAGANASLREGVFVPFSGGGCCRAIPSRVPATKTMSWASEAHSGKWSPTHAGTRCKAIPCEIAISEFCAGLVFGHVKLFDRHVLPDFTKTEASLIS